MFIAKDGNVVLTIAETDKDVYQKLGYDIYSEEGGKRTKLATGAGKVVSAEKYEKAQEEIAELKKALADSNKAKK